MSGAKPGAEEARLLDPAGPKADIRSPHDARRQAVAGAVSPVGRPRPLAVDGSGPVLVKPERRQELEDELSAARIAEEVLLLEVAEATGLFDEAWTRADLEDGIRKLVKADSKRKRSRSAQLARRLPAMPRARRSTARTKRGSSC